MRTFAGIPILSRETLLQNAILQIYERWQNKF